jgi:Mg/Co/Ni transporter MgtE
MAIWWFGNSKKKNEVSALRLRARSLAVLLFAVENDLRQELLELLPPNDQLLILEESEKALRYTMTERIDEISRYLEITVSRSLLREGSLEKKLVASLEAAFRADPKASAGKLKRRLHPEDRVTIGVALKTISEGKAKVRRQARVLANLPAEVAREILDHLPHQIASRLEESLKKLERDRMENLCNFLDRSPENSTLEELDKTVQALAESEPEKFASMLQEWSRSNVS